VTKSRYSEREAADHCQHCRDRQQRGRCTASVELAGRFDHREQLGTALLVVSHRHVALDATG
jgi:hypothetical protein